MENDSKQKLIDKPTSRSGSICGVSSDGEYIDNVKVVFKQKKDNVLASILILIQTLVVSLFFLYQRYVYSNYANLSYGKTNLFVGIFLTLITYNSARKENLAFSYDKKTNIYFFFRVMTSFSSESIMFLATKYARISSLSCIMIMYSIVSCIMVSLILTHKTSLKDYAYLVACCIGSILIIKPFSGQGEDTILGLSLGFASMFIFSSTIVINCIIGRTTHHFIMNFYCGVCFFILGVILCYFEGSFHINLVEFIVLSIVGLLYTSLRYLFNYALLLGDLHYILPFDNFSTVFCCLFSYFFLGDDLDYLDLIGTSIVLSICLMKSME